MLWGLFSQIQNLFEPNTVPSACHLQIEIVKAIPMKSQNEDIKTRSPLGIQLLFTIEFPGISLGLLIYWGWHVGMSSTSRDSKS